MYYLLGSKHDPNHMMMLYIKGDEFNNSFLHNEGLFVVELRSNLYREELKERVEFLVKKQIGHIDITNDKLSFIYTDEDFKEAIQYDEDTGFSRLDGRLWKKLKDNSNKPQSFMYVNAKKPFLKLNERQSLVSQGIFAGKETKGNEPRGEEEQSSIIYTRNT